MKNRAIIYMLLGIGSTFVSCKDDWDAHYESNGSVPTVNLMDVIGQDDQLSLFHQILKDTQADTLLTSSKTYTVWAPINEVLKTVDMTDKAAMRRLVSNHIAPYAYPTSTEAGKSVYMYNDKSMFYDSPDVFGGVRLTDRNILAQNGIVHKMSDTIPYRYNFWEYMSIQEKYSKAYNFIKQFSEQIYDTDASTPNDSVFRDYNPLMQGWYYSIGWINDEDSVYTMILPDNEAWDKAYAHISPYFKVYDKDQAKADSITEVQTGQAILSGLTFGGRITEPASKDSLVLRMRNVTTGEYNVIYEPERYFEGYPQMQASNGLMYFADGDLNMDDSCVWNQTIVIEGENLNYRKATANGTAYIRNVDVTSKVQGISDFSYLEVNGGASNPSVTFELPQVLAGKYDIYVDFVPPLIDGEDRAEEATRLNYTLTFRNSNGGNKAVRRNGRNDDDLIFAGNGLEDNRVRSVKVWSAHEFPVSNFYDALWLQDEENSAEDIKITTTLLITTNVIASELNKPYVRRFRIDKIRLVPSKENNNE